MFGKTPTLQESTAPGAVQPLRQLLDCLAARKDSEIGNVLLKQLVSRYAQVERELKARQDELQQDLQAAAEIQRSLLPQKQPATDAVTAAWRFMPCDAIGGDCFDVLTPAAGLLCAYMLDVSGHGVPAAMIAVSVVQALRPGNAACQLSETKGCSSVSPAHVLDVLDTQFPLERFDRHFTLCFLALHEETGELLYSAAGHPPPILLKASGDLYYLEEGGPVIGLNIMPFTEGHVRLEPGDRVLLYTDGVTECESPEGEFYGDERFHSLLAKLNDENLDGLLQSVIDELRSFCGRRSPRDDISMLALEYHGRKA